MDLPRVLSLAISLTEENAEVAKKHKCHKVTVFEGHFIWRLLNLYEISSIKMTLIYLVVEIDEASWCILIEKSV